MRPSGDAHDTPPKASMPPRPIVRTDTVSTLPAAATAHAAPDHLNVAERFAARVGEWVGALSMWWAPEYAPPFAGDGQLAALCIAFVSEPSDHCCPEAC